MGVRFPSNMNTNIANATIATSGRTVVLVSPPISVTFDTQGVLITWYLLIQPGASTNSIRLTINRGPDTTGIRINNVNNCTIASGTSLIWSGSYVDFPGAVANQQYSIDLSPGGAAATGNVSEACIATLAL